ncbi:MAG: hypothetical protein IJD22_06110, partial [Clostridia bacterium]|nr:hypothetical protein [Clostridia bacterium]
MGPIFRESFEREKVKLEFVILYLAWLQKLTWEARSGSDRNKNGMGPIFRESFEREKVKLEFV